MRFSAGALASAGASGGVLRDALAAHGDARIATLIEADMAAPLVPQGGLVLDEEALPLKPHSLDLIVSLWGLHNVNDLPGALLQIRHALNPDGLFSRPCPAGQHWQLCGPHFCKVKPRFWAGRSRIFTHLPICKIWPD